MHREGLFFDPLQGEPAAPPAGSGAPDPAPLRRPDAEELQAQRQRELARVQDELRKLAQGSGAAVGRGPRVRRRPVADR